jgi:putative nucleotidyltransferase with HDIG domain
MYRFTNNRTVIPRDVALRLWIVGLAVGAIAWCAILALSGYGLGNPVALALLAILALGAEHESIHLRQGVEVSVASILCIFAAVVFGPLGAIIVGSAGLLADLPRRDVAQPTLRWLHWTSVRVFAAGGAGLAASAVISKGAGGFWTLLAAVAAAFAVETLVDITVSPIAPAIRGSMPWRSTVASLAPAIIASVPLQALMVTVLAYAYTTISPWSVALFALPAVAAQRLLILYRQQGETVDALGSANAQLAKASLSFATALVATLDARDRYTAGHSAAVSIYARDIAARMGLTQEEQDLVHLCGLVHDVGKIGLSAGLLEKPGPLTLEERRQMEQHPTIGERILRNVDDYADIAHVVRHHHERVDGNGYPDQLVGDEIPLLARILTVADSYNAMTSDRPYRDAMPSRVARLRIAQAVESQFDTSVVAAFEAILASASEDYRTGRGPAFALASLEAVRVPERVDEPESHEALGEIGMTLVSSHS